MTTHSIRVILLTLWAFYTLQMIGVYAYGGMDAGSLTRLLVRTGCAWLAADMLLPSILFWLRDRFIGMGHPTPDEVFPTDPVSCPVCGERTWIRNGKYEQHWFNDEEAKIRRTCDDGTGLPYMRRG